METVSTPGPEANDHHEEDQDDDHVPTFPRPPPNAAMGTLLEQLKAQGFTIARFGSNDWRIPCPHHPTLGVGANPNTVQLEQQPNDTVWVHRPDGWRACSCTAEQIIAGYQWTDPRITPAGTVVTDAGIRDLMAATIRETYGAITWDDTETGGGDWLDEPLIERGQFTSIYGPAGIGKSLLVLQRRVVTYGGSSRLR